MLMVMENRMSRIVMAFHVLEILEVQGVFSSFFPSQAIRKMSENASENKPKVKQAYAPLLYLKLKYNI